MWVTLILLALNKRTSLYKLLKQVGLPMHFYKLLPRAESLAFDGDVSNHDGGDFNDDVVGAGDSNVFLRKLERTWAGGLLNSYTAL